MSRAKVSEIWDAVADAGALSPGWGGLPGTDAGTHAQVMARLRSADLGDWASTAARVGFCSNPVRLVGSSVAVDPASGEVLRSYASADEPGGVTFVRCGNRRADRCPSCSRLYAADTFHLIRAGVAGGKGVPESVADNPLVFVTLTAPSFGAVHGRRRNCRCRPRAASAAHCRHGRPSACFEVHEPDDPALGQPLCADCYDYESQVVWQWWAPELWRRFTIALKRRLAQLLGADLDHLGEIASLQSVTEVGGRSEWSTPKTHETRSVPVPRSLVELLRVACEGKTGDDVVFSAPGGGPLRLGNWRHRVFDPACAAVGLVGVTPHDLRHTAASLAIAAGANVKAVQRMLGHASAAMTLDIYAGLFGDDLDGVADALDDLVPQTRHIRHVEVAS